MEEQKEPYTWGQLKEFCMTLSEDQLSQTVKVIQEDGVIKILDAGEIGEDHYQFDDEEYSITRSDFDPEYDLDGKYKTFDEALENEKYLIVPSTTIYLYEDF